MTLALYRRRAFRKKCTGARCSGARSIEIQRTEWGRTNGETCVIELSGLAAHSQTVQRDRELFREERINVIRERKLVNRPNVVVMYGKGEEKSCEKIAGGSFAPGNIRVSDGTIHACTPHPVSHGMTNAFWEELGQQLRNRGLRL